MDVSNFKYLNFCGRDQNKKFDEILYNQLFSGEEKESCENKIYFNDLIYDKSDDLDSHWDKFCSTAKKEKTALEFEHLFNI